MDKIQRHFFAAAREGNIKLLKSLVSWDSSFSKSTNTCLNQIFLFSSFLGNTRQTSTVQTIRATPRYTWLRIGRMNEKRSITILPKLNEWPKMMSCYSSLKTECFFLSNIRWNKFLKSSPCKYLRNQTQNSGDISTWFSRFWFLVRYEETSMEISFRRCPEFQMESIGILVEI